MTPSDPSEEILGRSRRMSVGGRLAFRRRVQPIEDGGPLPMVDGGDDPPPLRELVPARFRRVEIEVGSGKGAFLCAAAGTSRTTFFLGIEAAQSYASYAAARLRDGGHDNALLLVDNASLFLRDRVVPGSVDRLHVYFPDPWPKRRHRGRRFFTEQCPVVVHRALRLGGLLCVATDNPCYAGQIARVLGAFPGLRRDEDAERELSALGPGHAFSPTNFERK